MSKFLSTEKSNQLAYEHLNFCAHGTNPSNMILCELDNLLSLSVLLDYEYLPLEDEIISFIKTLVS